MGTLTAPLPCRAGSARLGAEGRRDSHIFGGAWLNHGFITGMTEVSSVAGTDGIGARFASAPSWRTPGAKVTGRSACGSHPRTWHPGCLPSSRPGLHPRKHSICPGGALGDAAVPQQTPLIVPSAPWLQSPHCRGQPDGVIVDLRGPFTARVGREGPRAPGAPGTPREERGWAAREQDRALAAAPRWRELSGRMPCQGQQQQWWLPGQHAALGHRQPRELYSRGR